MSAKQTKRRRFVNNFLRPHFRLKSAFQLCAIVLIVIGTLLVLIQKQYIHIATMATTSPQELSLHHILIGIGIGLVLMGILIYGIAALTANTVVGPMIAFHRHVDSLLKNKFDSRINLRKHDEFKDLADKLNKLAEKLAKDSA